MAAGLDYEQALSALGVISGMAMPLLLFPVAFVSSVCTALLPAVTAAQAVGEQARVRVLTGRAVTTVGLIGIPATAVLVPLAPQLSELFFRQPLTGGYAALLGAAAVATYYQMATGSLLNALGLQRWNVATAISAELCQLALLYRWCARPTLGIYGYLLAMFFDRSERRCGQPCHPAPANSVPPETLPAVRRAAALRRCSLPVDSLFRADIRLPV